MASTFSTSLKLELIGNGDQSGTWGTTTNTNLGTLIEPAITGVQAITMTHADYTLSNLNGISDEARNAVLVVGGTNSAIRNVIAPAVNKTYIVANNTIGGFAIIIKTSASTGVSIANGATQTVYCNGTEFYIASFPSTGGTITGNLAISGTLDVTGIPTIPTATAGTNTTQAASTAFVQAATANTVFTTGNQTIGGSKTFSSTVLLSDGGFMFTSDGGQDTGINWASDGVMNVRCNASTIGQFTTSGFTGNSATATNATNATNSTNATNATNATTATNVTNALGQNQTLQNLTASRALGTTYTNSTGVAIYIWVQGTSNTYANYGTQIYLNGVMVSGTTMYTANTGYGSTTQTLVPAGFTYRITGNINLTTWYECR